MNKGKKKPEKFREKLDFKFLFHVTKVPQSGWEKLYVSLESVETGKTTAKTAKSMVQNGACRWPDAIIESTRLVHETRSNSYDTKLYKFVVCMSPTRVLGEITLNLADYVTASSASTCAFPLKNCSPGTVLHIKLQCLTSADASSELEQSKADQHISDDEPDDSSPSSLQNLPPPTPSKEQILARYNSDSSEASTPIANGNGRGGSHDVSSPTTSASGSSLNSRRRRASMDSVKTTASPARPTRASLPMRQSSIEGKVSIEGEETIAKVDVKSETIARLEQELESLKQQVCEKDEEIGGLIGERDNLDALKQQLEDHAVREELLKQKLEENNAMVEKLRKEEHVLTKELEEQIVARENQLRDLRNEIDQLRQEKQAGEEIQGGLKLQLEDCGHIIKELQQVVAYEKEMKNKVESQLTRLELQLMEEKLKQSEIQSTVEEKCGKITALEKEVEELEVDIKELTDENMDMIFKLNLANKEIAKNSSLGENEDQNPQDFLDEKFRKFREEYEAANQRMASVEELNRDLKAVNSELEEKLKKQVEELKVVKNDLKASRSMHSMDREAFSGRELRLKERAAEMQEKHEMTSGLLGNLQTELERLHLESSENSRRKDELEAALNSVEISKTDLAYRLADLESGNLKLQNLARQLEGEVEERTQELKCRVAKIDDLESGILMLEAANGELERTLEELQSRDLLSTSRIVDLEVQISASRRQIGELEGKKQELESRVDGLELEKYELGSMLRTGQEDSGFLKQKLEGTMGELADANAQLESELAARTTSEKKALELGRSKDGLEKEVRNLEDEKWQLTARIAGLEAQLSFLTEQSVELKKENSRLKCKSREEDELQKGFAQQIEETRVLVAGLEAEQEERVMELDRTVRMLEEYKGKLGEVNAEVERIDRCRLEAEESARKAEMEKSAAVERMQSELQKLTDQMDATCDERELLRRRELEEKLREAEADKQLVLETMEGCRKREVQLEKEFHSKVSGLEDALQQLKMVNDQVSELTLVIDRLQEAKKAVEGEKSALEEAKGALSRQLRELSSEVEELKVNIQQLQTEQSASRALEVEHRCESIKLRRQNSEMKQKMGEQESEKEELKKRLECLEADVRKRRPDENGKIPTGNGVLARSLSKCNVKVGTREAQELIALRERVKVLELELKFKTVEAESLRKKETNFLKRIQALEASDDGQQRHLQQEEMKLDPQELLQKELQRLQQVNMQLQEKLSRFKEVSKWGNTLEKVASLETELAEALESNTMYKEQLRSAFATQQNVHAAALQNLGDVDQVVSDLLGYKRKSSELETELCEMRERYLSMSLKFAQVEAEREELVMTVRSLKNGRKVPLF